MILEKLLEKKYLAFTVGCVQEMGIVAIFGILYDAIFIEYVREGKYTFLGSGYLFMVILAIFPIINLALKKHKTAIGNSIGVVVWFLIILPFFMLIGGA